MIEAELFQPVHHPPDSGREGRRTQSTEVMMVCHTFEEHLLAVQLQSLGLRELDGAYAKTV